MGIRSVLSFETDDENKCGAPCKCRSSKRATQAFDGLPLSNEPFVFTELGSSPWFFAVFSGMEGRSPEFNRGLCGWHGWIE